MHLFIWYMYPVSYAHEGLGQDYGHRTPYRAPREIVYRVLKHRAAPQNYKSQDCGGVGLAPLKNIQSPPKVLV